MDDQLRYYLRYHPHWYLILSRYPQEYNRLIQEYKDEKNQHFIDKIEQVSMLINMVEMITCSITTTYYWNTNFSN